MTGARKAESPFNGSAARARLGQRDLAYIGVFAAFVAALGVVPPLQVGLLGVPITAQTLGVMLAGLLLGPVRGLLALLTFLALVAVGLPLLPGGRGGAAVFVGPTGGFLLAWPLGAYFTGLVASLRRDSFPLAVLACIVGGIIVVYAVGVPFAAAVADVSVTTAFAGSAAFLPGDAIKVVLAAAVASQVRRALPSSLL